MARDAFSATLPSATAAGSSVRGTSSGTIAAHAGLLSAAPTPSANVSPMRSHGVVSPQSVQSPSVVAVSSIHAWVARR
jgi:hypothetical protein